MVKIIRISCCLQLRIQSIKRQLSKCFLTFRISCRYAPQGVQSIARHEVNEQRKNHFLISCRQCMHIRLVRTGEGKKGKRKCKNWKTCFYNNCVCSLFIFSDIFLIYQLLLSHRMRCVISSCILSFSSLSLSPLFRLCSALLALTNETCHTYSVSLLAQKLSSFLHIICHLIFQILYVHIAITNIFLECHIGMYIGNFISYTLYAYHYMPKYVYEFAVMPRMCHSLLILF